LQEREGSSFSIDRLQLLIAVLRHPSLLSSYLANMGKPSTLGATRDAQISGFLACILERYELAQQADEGILSRDWAEVSASTVPYLSRYFLLSAHIHTAAARKKGSMDAGAPAPYIRLLCKIHHSNPFSCCSLT
jgi:hypothetical protein